MTSEEIVRALRCCESGECSRCPLYSDKQRCQENLLCAAAELIARLEKEKAAAQWIPATEPPKEWKDEKTGYLKNYLINGVYSGVDVGSYDALAGCWKHCGLPLTVTHWMQMPEAPEVK